MKIMKMFTIMLSVTMSLFLMSFKPATIADTSVSSNEVITSPTGGWPEAEQKAFMESCVESAKNTEGINAKKYCSCMLDKIMDKYPDVQDAVKMSEEEILKMAPDCIK